VKTKRHEGTGLGLTITKNLVRILRGGISMHSEYGKGTTFEVRIPSQVTAGPVTDVVRV